jgi:cytochrome c-type biogenesis protein CcmH
LLTLFVFVPAFAQEPPPAPDRPLPDAAQEARAQALFRDIRCVVCQHEAISDSPAGVAADLRQLVREEIAAGRSDDQVKADLVRRYGDFVLFKPPVRGGTWLLWFGPATAVLLAALALWRSSRRRRIEAPALSADEEVRLNDILSSAPRRRDPDANPSDD